MSETEELKRMQLALAREPHSVTLFRNNTGQGWVGESRRYSQHATARVGPGDVVIRNARPLHAGLVVGSSDLIGWTPVRITIEMVGRLFAVFTAVEGKTATGRASPEQLNFIEQVRKAGGFAGIAHTAAEAAAIVHV